MADEKSRDNPEEVETLANNYPGNSRRPSRDKEKASEERHVKNPIVKGHVRQQKRSLGKKMADTFLEDDTKSVGSYVIWDVVVPAAKSMICDMVGWGGIAEMILFGTKKGGRGRRDPTGRAYTSYGSFYSGGRPNREADRDDHRAYGRNQPDFNDIWLESRGEAEEVLSTLVDFTLDYGRATVNDLYDLVGITGSYTDVNYGWTDLRSAGVSRSRDGYILNLPRPRPLN